MSEETKQCPFCAETIKAEAVVCRYCGRDLNPQPAPSQPIAKTNLPAADPAEEKVILSEGDVKITNLRAVINSKTYAMSNITSVKVARKDPPALFPLLLFAAGGISGLVFIASLFRNHVDFPVLIFAAAGIGGGILVFKTSKPLFTVHIGSASGETDAMSTYDAVQVKRISDAINAAIISRG